PLSSTGDGRDVTSLGIIQNNFGNETYFIEGNIGSGLDGSVRGNPDNDDMIFITQIKLSYALGSRTRRRAKYR
ncbi:MAG: hypothetical protein AAFY41_12015, partial [Bacteroidota bacterium]